MQTPAHQNTEFIGDRAGASVEHILRRGAVRMLFQPIVGLDSGSVVAFEALIRPKRGFNSATDLLTEAARCGSLPAVDRLAHSIALASAGYLPAENRLFINASPAAMTDPGFALGIARRASIADIAPKRVVVEITELGAPADDGRLSRTVEDLRAQGFGIAIDDVGAGQSDLSRILKFRPHWIKIDRALIQSLAADSYSRSLVAALARFAAHNSIRVVAEGIELPSQARAVADLGIAFGQGYWFDHPLALVDATSNRCSQRVLRRWRTASRAA
jgi:EAL domain-containing protein (putative c-di-GMP-specific phosphodiesterase class I)